MRRILIFVYTRIGGAERISLNIAKVLYENNFNVNIIFVGEKYSPIINEVKDIPTEYIHIKKFKFSLLKFYNILKKEKDAVCFSSLHGISIPLLIIRLFNHKIKIIIRHSFMPDRFNKYSLDSILIRLCYPLASAIIAQTDKQKDMIMKYYNLNENKIIVINNLIDIENVKAKCQDEIPFSFDKRIVYVAIGNVRKIKRYDLLIKAFNEVNREIKKTYLYIIGDTEIEPDYYKYLKQLVRILDLEKHVNFLGYVENPYPYLARAHCFLLSSENESYPNSLMEALLLGKTIVATRCFLDIDEITAGRKNVYITDVNNVIDLSAAMKEAAKNSGLINFNISNKEFEREQERIKMKILCLFREI